MKSVPFRRIVRPTTDGSPANSRFQKSGPSTTTASRPGTCVFVVPETAPERRLDAEHAEVVAGDEQPAPDARRRAGLGAEADRAERRVGDHAVVALRVVADVQVLAIGEGVEGVVVRGAHERDDVARVAAPGTAGRSARRAC